LPPILALILCSVFVLFLLRLEHKQSPHMTLALWIPTIWMLYIGSKPLSIWFPSSGGDLDSGSPLDRTFLIAIMCVALFILIQRRFDWSRAIKENAWLIVLIVFMLASVLWSNIPDISFRRWIREFQAILMAFAVLSEPSPRQAMESILRRTTYILIPFSVLLIKYFPTYGVMYATWSGGQMWTGVTLHKNSLGRLCIIAIFFLFWSLIRRWQGHDKPVWKYQTHTEIFILVIALWLLGGPERNLFNSATSVYALISGLLFYGGLYILKKFGKNLRLSTLATIVLIIIIYGIFSVFTGGSSVNVFASTAGRSATLTGRTEIWAALLPAAMQKPIVGSGFGGFWTSRTRDLFQISEAHNGYLEVLLGLGFVGILLVSLFLLSCCQKAQREILTNFDWGVLCICYIIMAVVHNIGESSIDTLTTQMMAIVLFLSVSSTPALSRELQL